MGTNSREYQREYMKARRTHKDSNRHDWDVIDPVYSKMLDQRPKLKRRLEAMKSLDIAPFR